MINLKWLIAGSIFAAMSAITGISVVIPNYNGLSLLPQVLPTVVAALHQIDIASEIIVVDDCSTDDSVEMLENNFPAVKILKNENEKGTCSTFSGSRGIPSSLSVRLVSPSIVVINLDSTIGLLIVSLNALEKRG